MRRVQLTAHPQLEELIYRLAQRAPARVREDIYQALVLAYLEASAKKQKALVTRIYGAHKDYWRAQDPLTRPERAQYRAYQRAVIALTQVQGAEPNAEAVCTYLGITEVPTLPVTVALPELLGPDPELKYIEREQLARLVEAVAALPEPEQRALMADLCEQPLAELAAADQVTVSRVSQRKKKAVTMLRARLV